MQEGKRPVISDQKSLTASILTPMESKLLWTGTHVTGAGPEAQDFSGSCPIRAFLARLYSGQGFARLT